MVNTKIRLIAFLVAEDRKVVYSQQKEDLERRRIDAFELWCWKRLLRVPWTARRSNQSILKEINPEHSLEGLMLKLKLQYFGHLIGTADSLEKTFCCRERLKVEQQPDWGWDGWIASLIRLGKPQEMVRDREAWCAAVHGVTKVRHHLVTKHHHLFSRWPHPPSPLCSCPSPETMASLFFLEHDIHVPAYISLCDSCLFYLEWSSPGYLLGFLNPFQNLMGPKQTTYFKSPPPPLCSSHSPSLCSVSLMAPWPSNTLYSFLILCLLFCILQQNVKPTRARAFICFCSLKYKPGNKNKHYLAHNGRKLNICSKNKWRQKTSKHNVRSGLGGQRGQGGVPVGR